MRTKLVPALLRAVLGVAVGVTITAITGRHDLGSIFAEHTVPARLTEGLHGGAYTANYTLCTNDPITQAQWSGGPETWEQVMVERITLNQTPTECNAAALTKIVMMWEYTPPLVCPSNVFACYFPPPGSPNFVHSTNGFSHLHVAKAYIMFDEPLYSGLASDAWRNAVAVHEMGHAMSLADHETSQCAVPFRIMGQLELFATNPCIGAPNQDEICSAWNFYSYDGNADANFIDLPPSKAYDDLTMVHSDNAEDGCDGDADNDGLTNAAERYTPCGSSSGPTNQRVRDTDGDRVVDVAECFYGSDPANAGSVPGVGGTDSDNDLLHNGLEALWGSNPNNVDSDGDGVIDGVEYRYYGSEPITFNTDEDACHDGKEVASINADLTVNIVDLQQVAAHVAESSSPNYIVNFDINKNGSINIADIQLVAAAVGPCV